MSQAHPLGIRENRWVTKVPKARHYRNFADLSAAQSEGTHYRLVVTRVEGSRICVLAPHAGRIEFPTSSIARLIAGREHNLYLFEGIRQSNNYEALYLTSHRFDEPRCLELLADCDEVVAIHGYREAEESVIVGGLDAALRTRICDALNESGVKASVGIHRFAATDPMNICNRSSRRVGVQLELSNGLRNSESVTATLVSTLRRVLATKG